MLCFLARIVGVPERARLGFTARDLGNVDEAAKSNAGLDFLWVFWDLVTWRFPVFGAM